MANIVPKGDVHLIRPDFRITLRGLENQINKHWCLTSYLILNIHFGDLVELAERELPQTFAKEMAKHVYGYIYENKMPPAEIEQTVLNVSEDLIAGRQVQLRAGDYIASQKFFRRMK
jgi:hypothetical protein